ncbi:MAG: ABC transporter permease [Myxococcales bacterium]|nr:ABC transporter permease [Myxococcales bacterium]
MRSAARKLPSWIGPLVALLVVYALFAVLAPDTFLRGANTASMAQRTVVVAVCSLGMTMVIATGGIDLATGSLVALTTVLVAKLLTKGVSPAVACLLAVGAATTLGAFVGLVIGRFKMLPFVVTLGSMSMLRGLAKGIASEQKIDCDPRGIDRLVAATHVVSPSLWASLALAIVVGVVLTGTRFGRHVFAVGSNEATARLVGINTARVKVLVYAASSLLAGVAGIFEFATLTVGDPTDAIGLELKVIAAVVIGGGSLSGGEGSVVGALLGALLMTVIETGGVHLGMPGWVQEIVAGAIIVLAVALDRARAQRAA